MKEFLKEIKESLSQNDIKYRIIEIAKRRGKNVDFETSIHIYSEIDLISNGKLEFFKGENGIIVNKIESGYLFKFDLVVRVNALLLSITLEEDFSSHYLKPYNMIFSRFRDEQEEIHLDQISVLGNLLNTISLGNISLYRGEDVIFRDSLSEVNYSLNSISVGEELERSIDGIRKKIIPVIMPNIGVVFRYSSIPIIYVDEEFLEFSKENPITAILSIDSRLLLKKSLYEIYKMYYTKISPITIEAQLHTIILH